MSTSSNDPGCPRARTGVGLSILLLGCLGLGAGCGGDDAAESGPQRVVPSVEAVRAGHGALPLRQRLSGLVRAHNQVEIYPQINAIIEGVLAENGDAVERGDPLVRLRDRDFQQRLKQARANHRIALAELRRAEALLAEARTELERERSLQERDLTSAADLEAAQTRTESAGAEVELAQARVEQSLAGVEEQEENLSETLIRAPITGSVGNRNAEVGMLATPSARLFTLGQLDSVRVEVVLTDRMLAYIEEGQRAEISTGGSTASAELSRISPFLHPVAHSTEAEIDLQNPDGVLKPGMFVTVDVFYGETEEATLVPLSALYENPETGVVGVYATQESLAVAPPIDLESSDGERPSEFAQLSDPVLFEFIPTEVIAEGRMEAAVRSVEPDTWVITVGQNLLGGEDVEARVRPVTWDRIERMQSLQEEDLMQEVIEPRSAGSPARPAASDGGGKVSGGSRSGRTPEDGDARATGSGGGTATSGAGTRESGRTQ